MGIDYGNGKTNIDTETCIRFGVLQANKVGQAWYDESEPQYGQPCCPNCGNELDTVDNLMDQVKELFGLDEEADFHCTLSVNGNEIDSEQWCTSCGEGLDDLEDCYPESPLEHTYNQDGYLAKQGGDDCDIFLIKSPYYTWCDFCSPCAPGAGYLTSSRTIEDSEGFTTDGWDTTNDCKAYCFGHDWFEDNKAPYKVFSVETDEEVLPE